MFPCEIKHFPARPTLSIRFRAPAQDLSKHFGRAYTTILNYVEELGGSCAGPAFAIYHNLDMQNMDIEAGFPVAHPLPPRSEIRAGEIAGGTFAVCHYTGPYDQLAPAYDALSQFAVKQGYQPGNIAYEWYLNGPETPVEELKTDISFPVTRLVTEKA
ncbi:MAG: AraC family transcriptional regulator [Anaerolineaceae bacterium]|nr:AraC family transcriptional regulator [Anaerolineaceae bacterium]